MLPIDANSTQGRVIVWVERSRNAIGRIVFDPLNAIVRRSFIQTFLRSDLPRIAGLRYQPGSLIAADGLMADYFAWLESNFKLITGQKPMKTILCACLDAFAGLTGCQRPNQRVPVSEVEQAIARFCAKGNNG